MRPVLCIIFIILFTHGYGQTITGKIRDKYSFKPLIQVKVKSSLGTVYSDTNGEFRIQISSSDSLQFSLAGYHKFRINTDSLEGRTNIFVELTESSIPIEEVVVSRKTNKKDTFNFKLNLGIPKTPTYRTVILDRSSLSNQPKLKSSGSTSSLITVDLLSLSRMIFKRKPKPSLEEIMDQELINMQYIDMKFSTSLIEELTGLKDDACLIFQNSYRPSMLEFRKMTDIDLRNYIIEKYKEYKQQVLPSNK